MVAALCKELALQKGYLAAQQVNTVYFGGGTPSLLSVAELMQIWRAIEQNFPDLDLEEVTLEANPDNLSTAYLRELKHTPINRLSIGIQSFRDEDLRYMNRAHDAREADYAVKAAQDAGFDNISLDLIYGSPGLSDTDWQRNIQKATDLQVPHISSYALTVEPRTALAHAIAKGQTPAPESSRVATQFELLMLRLKAAGFEHYEISNFARPGRYAVHNTRYWQGHHYLGIGPSAHSFNRDSRQWNLANNPGYIESILVRGKVPFELEQLSETDRFNEYLMTSLRTMWGADLHYIDSAFGAELLDGLKIKCAPYLAKEWIREEKGNLVLSDEGKLWADKIAADLFM